MAAGQTVVTYGNWRLYRCTTLDFRQEPVYDDMSQTDLLYHRFTVKVSGYIHGMHYYSGGPAYWCTLNNPAVTNDSYTYDIQSASLNHVAMRVELPPRQKFTYRIGADSSGTSGGYVALYAEAFPDPPPEGITHLDVNNGPRCKSFVVTRVVSDNIFQVEAEFEVCKVECSVSATELPASDTNIHTGGTAPNKNNGVLSNRWSVVDEIDDNLKTERVYHGRLRVASANIDPGQFRFYVTPPLQPGMRRSRISFSVSPDGLNLDYMVRDVEVVSSAPPPAKKWSVQHTESVDQALGVHASCDVSLTADRNTGKADLIIIGMNVLITKLLDGNRNANNTTLVENLSITDFIGDDLTVAVSGQVRRIPKNVKNAANQDVFEPWFLGNKIIGKPLAAADVYLNDLDDGQKDPNYDGSQSYGGLETTIGLPGDKPYYEGPVKMIGRFLPYLQTPCDDIHKIVKEGSSLPDDDNSDAESEPQTVIEAAVDPNWTDSDRSLYSTSEKSAMYTQWKMESTYKDRSMKLALPIAASSYYTEGQQTMKIITLGRPQSRRVVRAEAERLGQWPEMPSPSQLEAIVGSTSGLVQTYLGCKRRYATPFYTAGGQRAYRVAIDFYFSLNKPASAADTLAVGRTMWTTDGNIVTSSYATNGWV